MYALFVSRGGITTVGALVNAVILSTFVPVSICGGVYSGRAHAEPVRSGHLVLPAVVSARLPDTTELSVPSVFPEAGGV